MNVTTKQEVVQYIISRTREIQMNSDLEPLTTNAVADAVKISRNLASFYLNELKKEKILLTFRMFNDMIANVVTAQYALVAERQTQRTQNPSGVTS